MSDDPGAFFTPATIQSLAGQVLLVGMLTQVIRSAMPDLATYWVRSVAVVAGILVHGLVVWTPELTLAGYVLAFANGTMVSLSAMKGAELVKAKAAATPARTRARKPPPAVAPSGATP